MTFREEETISNRPTYGNLITISTMMVRTNPIFIVCHLLQFLQLPHSLKEQQVLFFGLKKIQNLL